MKTLANIILVLLSPILLTMVVIPEFFRLLAETYGKSDTRRRDSTCSKSKVSGRFQRFH